MTDITIRKEGAMQSTDTETVSQVVREIMRPLFECITEMISRNTEAMERIAAAQQMASERISELEKRVRLQTPLSPAQERHINEAMGMRAKELLAAKECADDRKTVNKVKGAIRKAILARYGAGSLREAPAYDYETMLKQIGIWNNMLLIREAVKEARERSEKADMQEP